MKLKQHYDKLWNHSIEKFKAGNFDYDPLINSANDRRYGITLLARPSKEVKKAITETLEEIQSIAPNQYYYPQSDLHLTILSIISCYPDFSLNQINPTEYNSLINSVVTQFQPFTINFKGITASSSAILIQGFPETNQLNQIRNQLREIFKQSNLEHSIDERYFIQTAHLTVIRFQRPFSDPKTFLKEITNLRNRDFGSCLINGKNSGVRLRNQRRIKTRS